MTDTDKDLLDALRSFAAEHDGRPPIELAPNYALLSTGERAKRVFIVGTLTETTGMG